MDRALKWFTNGWAALAILVNVVAVVGLFIGAPTFWAGWTKVRETYSPFNIYNMFMELVLFAPAIGAAYWRNRRLAARSK